MFKIIAMKTVLKLYTFEIMICFQIYFLSVKYLEVKVQTYFICVGFHLLQSLIENAYTNFIIIQDFMKYELSKSEASEKVETNPDQPKKGILKNPVSILRLKL